MEIKLKTSREKYKLEMDNEVPRIVKALEWYVEAEYSGHIFALEFDHEPTEAEIAEAIEQGQARKIITVEMLSDRLAEVQAESERLKSLLADLTEIVLLGGGG